MTILLEKIYDDFIELHNFLRNHGAPQKTFSYGNFLLPGQDISLDVIFEFAP